MADVAYIGRATCCGNVVACQVADEEFPSATDKRQLAKMVMDGLVVQRVSVEEARRATWGCKCERR